MSASRLLASALAAVAFAPFGGGPVDRDVVGRSTEGRPIAVYRFGDRDAVRKLLVVGCIHGNECAGMAVTRRLLEAGAPVATEIWVVQNLNPDGLARGTRQNGRGVDLNRNFGAMWRPIGRPWDPQHSGPRSWSEPETRLARELILRIRPTATVWFHQPQALVRAWGPSRAAARRYARLAGMRYRSLPWPNGTGPHWQNRRFSSAPAFVVELPPGPVTDSRARRHVDALLRLVRTSWPPAK